MSPWPVRVGKPVDGPPRCTFTTTQGVSVMIPRPMFSIIRLKPGPEVEVIENVPAHDAPRMAFIDAISSSIWMKTPPTSGSLRAMRSATSVAGVMG